MSRQWSCLIRVHRPSRALTQAKRRNWPDYTDIYGVDKPATVHPDYDEVVVGEAQAIGLRRRVLTCRADLDIQAGYIVEVKKTRYVSGVLEAVSETVSPDPAEDAESLTVSSNVKFEPGDHCVLEDAAGPYAFRLKGTSGTTTLTLYEDEALPRAFASASVGVKEYYIARQVRDRPAHSEWQDVVIVQVPVEEIAA